MILPYYFQNMLKISEEIQQFSTYLFSRVGMTPVVSAVMAALKYYSVRRVQYTVSQV